jgi:signal transduction histidine kinase/CheY-like chemotaxis protein
MHSRQPDIRKEDILVVDDTPENLRLLFQILTDKGYKVRAVPDGARALKAARTLHPDLILLDIMMPGLSGYEVCARLKAQAATRDVPVIFMSSLDATADKVNAFATGGVDYVTKPFRAEEVLARVETHLALQRRNRELALLSRVGQELTVTLDQYQVIRQMLAAVTDVVGAQGALAWLWDVREYRSGSSESSNDVEEDWLVCQVCFNHELRRFVPVNLRLRLGQGVAGWVVQHGQSVIVPDAPHDFRFFPGIDQQIGQRRTSLLVLPLRIRGKVIGALEIFNKLGGAPEGRFAGFDADDQTLAETLAASAAIAIDNARLVEVLHRYTGELEMRNEELDAFAHTVAHDLKGPLGYMVGFAQTLEDYSGLSDEELQRYLCTIAQSGRKMGNIVDELLLLASVRKMEEMEMEALDMASVVAEAQSRLADIIEQHQAQIVLPPSWPGALGYGPWVEEVWVNYLSNAIKYGGKPPRVELGFLLPASDSPSETPPATSVRFWVRDNGPGLTTEEQGRLFRPFERLEQVRAKGHGLGLSIARRIVERLDGEVGVESKVNQGSVFWFTLPSLGSEQ